MMKSLFLLLVNHFRWSLIIIILISLTHYCTSTGKFKALQDVSDEGYEGYNDKVKEKQNYLSSVILSKNLKNKQIDQFYAGDALNSDSFSSDDKSLSDIQNVLYNYKKSNKHKRNIDNADQYRMNSEINKFHASNSGDIGNYNLDDFYRIMKSVKKNKEKNSASNDFEIGGNMTHLNNGYDFNQWSESANDVYGNENKTKLLFNDSKKNLNCHKADGRDDEDDEYEYSEDEINKDESNFEVKGNTGLNKQKINYEKKDLEKIITSSLSHHNSGAQEAKYVKKFDNTISDSDKKAECNDHVIVQPIQQNKIKDKYDFIVKGKYLNEISNNRGFVGSDTIGLNERNCGKKERFLQPLDEYMKHNEQYDQVLHQHDHRFNNILKKIHEQRNNFFDNTKHRIKRIGAQYFNDVDNSRSNRGDYLNSESVSDKKKNLALNQNTGENCHVKLVNLSNTYKYENNDENKPLENEAISSEFEVNYIKKPFKTAGKLSDFELNDERKFPLVSKAFSKNKDFLKNSHKRFCSGDVEGNNNVNFMQNNFNPLLHRYDHNLTKDSITYGDINPLENLSQNYASLVNFCSGNGSIVPSDFLGDHNMIYSNDHYRQEKSLPSEVEVRNKRNLGREPLLNVSEIEGPKFRRSKRKNADKYDNVRFKDKVNADLKKRSLLHKPNVVLQQFHRNDFTDDRVDYTEEMGNFSNGNAKSSNTIYDYDFSENDENSRENHFDDINSGGRIVFAKGKTKQVSEPVYEWEKFNEIGKNQKLKNSKKKVNKSATLLEGGNNVPDEGKRIVSFRVKKNKNKQKKVNQSCEDSSMRITTDSVSESPEKKFPETGSSIFRNRLSGKPVGKQCHPLAGPPKFRWCSENTDVIKDKEYEDALKGKIALRIVEVILDKVEKSSKMTNDFGFCKNHKRPIPSDEERQCSTSNSILKSQDLKEIMSSLDKMSYKGCNQLPPKLKEFLEWLVKVKRVRSIHSMGLNLGKQSLSDCFLGDSAFLFHNYNTRTSGSYSGSDSSRKGYFPSRHENIEFDNVLSSDKRFLNKRSEIGSDVAVADRSPANDYSSLTGKELGSSVVAADENLFNDDSDSIAQRLKLIPELVGKKRRRTGENEIDFIDTVINPDDPNSRDNILGYSYPSDNVLNGLLKNEKRGDLAFDYRSGDNNVGSLSDLMKYDSMEENIRSGIGNGQEPLEKFKPRGLKKKSLRNNFYDLDGIHVRRDAKKLKLQELFKDKSPSVNFEIERNKRNGLTGGSDSGDDVGADFQKQKREISDGNEREFYTPVLFHVKRKYPDLDVDVERVDQHSGGLDPYMDDSAGFQKRKREISDENEFYTPVVIHVNRKYPNLDFDEERSE